MPSHHSPCLSPDGPTQNSRWDFSFCACLSEVWSTLLRPWIVSSHHFTTAVTEGDGSVRVLRHHGSKQPTSNSEPTLRNGALRSFLPSRPWLLPLGSSVALAEDMKLPPLKKQPT